MSESSRKISTVARIPAERETCTRIEELPVILMVKQHSVILRSGHVQPDSAVLQIGIGSHPWQRLHFGTDKCIRFLLQTVV